MAKTLNKVTYPAFIIALSTLIFSCQKDIKETPPASDEIATKAIPPQQLKDFTQVNLVGDNDEYSPARIDPNLVNAWGIAFSTFGTIWVSSEERSVSTVYNGQGNDLLPPVNIPSPGAATGGHPSGQVFNSTPDFVLTNGSKAAFIFAGLDGVISGWNPAAGTQAIRMINDSPDASYFGVAIASDGGKNFLYAANFAEREIDVYDKNWVEIEGKEFKDPNLPDGYSPFNIQAIDNKLYVMYAKIEEEEVEEVTGATLGFVDVYNPDGSFIKRLVSRGQLNAPWGITKAPAGFWGQGGTSNVFLIGNFGDGHINAFDESGNFLGELREHGKPIEIEGLWGIGFAPSNSTTVNPNWLYFAAGPDDEEHGLFGYLKK